MEPQFYYLLAVGVLNGVVTGWAFQASWARLLLVLGRYLVAFIVCFWTLFLLGLLIGGLLVLSGYEASLDRHFTGPTGIIAQWRGLVAVMVGLPVGVVVFAIMASAWEGRKRT